MSEDEGADCTECEGECEIECPECGGDGCESCGDSGNVECPWCLGDGVEPESS
jgi:hypothetical protein